jgi:hypothetical protein
VLKAGVHRLRVSEYESGALDLFGVLAGGDSNGGIFGDATFPPVGSTVRTRRNQAAINTGPAPSSAGAASTGVGSVTKRDPVGRSCAVR